MTSTASTRPSGQRKSRSYIMGSLPSSWRHTSTWGRQAELHELFGGLIVGSLRVSTSHNAGS